MYPTNKLPGNLQSLQGLRVLVVDSNNDYCHMISVLLQHYSMEVLTSSSVQQAFEIFIEWLPDILVSEIGKSYEDGYVLIQLVRNKAGEHGKGVIAIALIDCDNQNIYDGFDMQFTKPLDLDKFIAELACLVIS